MRWRGAPPSGRFWGPECEPKPPPEVSWLIVPSQKIHSRLNRLRCVFCRPRDEQARANASAVRDLTEGQGAQPTRSLSSMENGLPVSIRTAIAMHTRPSARVSRASYAPVVTPVSFSRSSWSTAPSGSLAHWLGPKADVPAGASSSDWTVEDVRFQKRVSFAAAGSARMIAAALSRIANFIIPPLALAPMANDDGAPHQPTQRLKATLSGRLLSFGCKRLPKAHAT